MDQYGGQQNTTFCPGCGAQVARGAGICVSCGCALAAQPAYQQPAYRQPMYQQPVYRQPMYQQPTYRQPPVYQPPVQPYTVPVDPFSHIPKDIYVSKRDFVKKYAPASFYKELRNVSIACYILSAVSFLIGIGLAFSTSSLFSWVDVVDYE